MWIEHQGTACIEQLAVEWELHRLNVTLGARKNVSLLAIAYINLCLFTSLLSCGSSVLVTFRRCTVCAAGHDPSQLGRRQESPCHRQLMNVRISLHMHCVTFMMSPRCFYPIPPYLINLTLSTHFKLTRFLARLTYLKICLTNSLSRVT